MKRMTCLMVVMGMGFSAMAQAAESPATQPALTELRPILSPEARADTSRKLIDRFVAHVQGSEVFAPPAKSAVAEGWKTHRSDSEPEGFLSAGLAIVSEPFKTGLTALEEEHYDKAGDALKPLAESKDAYISLNATGLLARCLVEQEKLEEAEQLLKPLAARESDLIDKSFMETEVDFLLAYCQLSNLHYDEALASLERFEQEHADAPDRFRLPARQMLQELQVRRPEGLGEVSDLMVYAGRRLANGQPGKPVQIKQGRAVELLTKLIKEAEDREQQQKGTGCKDCQGKGCKKCKGGGMPKGAPWDPHGGAKQSALPGGKGQIGNLDRGERAKPGEEWGKMRPEERERILQSLRKNFPSRYRQLVEQYYKQLAKEK